MNFIIDNYATSEDTQPLYFNNALAVLGYKSRIFDPKRQSLYDVFDQHKPDIYITHGYRISKDLIHYIQNGNQAIDILVNVQSMKLDDIKNLSQYFDDNNIRSSFFFLNTQKEDVPKIKDRNVINICSCADTNLLNQKPTITYKLEKAIFLNSAKDMKTYTPPYHNISHSEVLKVEADFVLPEIVLGPLYQCYETIIFRHFNGHIPQAFFDAIMFGCKVYFDLDDNSQQDHINNLIKKMFKVDKTLDFKDSDKLDKFDELKNFIMDKHTDVNRVKTLLSNIKVKQ